MYQYLLTGTVLGICTYTDLKWRKVYVQIIASYFVFSVLGHLVSGIWLWQMGAAGTVPGVLCLMISWASKERLGYGDSLLIIVCGISLGAVFCLWICLTAFFWAGIGTSVLMICKKQKTVKEIPFVPFLFCGFLLQWIGSVWR